MKSENHEFIIPLTKIRTRKGEFIEWLDDQEIEYQFVEAVRQSPGFPPGWECHGPALKFSDIGGMVAFKLRWLL